MKSISFICQENGSNKEYHIQMVPQGSGFVINFQYGAIGSTLKPGTKTPGGPVDEVSAEKLFQKLIKERLAKGYTQTGHAKESSFSAEVITEKKTHGIFPQLLNNIDEDQIMSYINDDQYVMQEKKDGQRRMVIVGDKIIGLNKKGQEVSLQENIILSLDKATKEGGVFDGEIIGDKLFVFDLLVYNKKHTKLQPYIERIKLLETLDLGADVEVVKTAYTCTEKLNMYNDLKSQNAEGVVFKKKDSLYVAGRPSSGGSQLKSKFYKEASFIVKDITKGKRSVGLELINENGERVHMGKCTIPPNKEIPALNSVVEIRYLYAYKGGCIFQPTFKEIRNDVDIEECLMTQIIFKAEQEDEEE